jgi:anti-anti-sigma factor
MTEIHDAFQFSWHANVLVISVNGNVESVAWDLLEQAAEVILQPIADRPVPVVIFDLADVNFMGSAFLQLLLRCHTIIKTRGGELVLCGLNNHARELLSITALDTLWAIYDTRDEALEAVAE